MEYSGKLYGKVGDAFFSLASTTDDFEMLQKNVEQLSQKLRVAEKALDDIIQWNDDLEKEWGGSGERANSAMEKIMAIDGF